jgi:SAM-dependent methyltransferase
MRIDHTESFEDFGEQFLVDSKIDGYFGSLELLNDIVKPFDLRRLKEKVVMEVGCGSGRILKNLLECEPKKIIAVEPSVAIDVAQRNNVATITKIIFKNIKAEEIDWCNEIDFCFSIGVIHHIPNAEIAVKNVFNALKPGGEFIFWVYGYEGNEMYLAVFNNLRRITRLIPDSILRRLCIILNLFCSIYIVLARVVPLPMRDYMLSFFQKLTWEKRNYVIFDQLNPSFAKYYKRSELESLMKSTGFSIVSIIHRHSYSWTVIAKKISN